MLNLAVWVLVCGSKGPVGEEWIEELDGPDPEMSPLGRPLGDGVSLSCQDSIVSNNVRLLLSSPVRSCSSQLNTLPYPPVRSSRTPRMQRW